MIDISKLLKFKGVTRLLEIFALNDISIRFVGGCIRNLLMGLEFTDIDLVTEAKPDKVIEILNDAGIKVVPTGIKYGTVTAFIDDTSFEITTLRKDLICDGRYAEVEFGTSYQEDSSRRDFTINALSVSPDGELFDYHDGLKDLSSKTIKFIGNPDLRVQEDYLRILRLYRFYSYYGSKIDDKSREACMRHRKKLIELSAERIREEFFKILLSPKNAEVLHLMNQDLVLQEILPIEKVNLEWLSHLSSFTAQHNIEPSAIRNLMTIIYQANYFPFSIKSNQEKKYLKEIYHNGLIDNLDTFNLKRKFYALDRSVFREIVILSCTKYNISISTQELNDIFNIKFPIFPVKGRDLLEIKFIAGKEIGEMLQHLENLWRESDFTLQKIELLNIAKASLLRK